MKFDKYRLRQILAIIGFILFGAFIIWSILYWPDPCLDPGDSAMSAYCNLY